MHPIVSHETAKARIADMHRQAERARMAQAARAARKHGNTLPAPGHRAIALARRVLAPLRARRLRPAPAPTAQAPEATP